MCRKGPARGAFCNASHCCLVWHFPAGAVCLLLGFTFSSHPSPGTWGHCSSLPPACGCWCWCQSFLVPPNSFCTEYSEKEGEGRTWGDAEKWINSFGRDLEDSDGIPAELFQILKDDAVKVLHSICQHIWKTQQWPQDGKRSLFIPIPKKNNAKECSNYHTIALISHTSKVMLKILQVRLQQCVNHELPDVQADFKKGRGTRDQIASIRWIVEKAREFQKNINFCFIHYAKAFDCVETSERWEYQTTRAASWEIHMQVRKQQLELDMEQQTGSK